MIFLVALALFGGGIFLSARASAYGSGPRADTARRARHAQLQAQLASGRADQFDSALAQLAQLDEPGALDVWRAALANPNPQLQRAAWAQYRPVQATLSRKEFIPQVARINAPSEAVQSLARASDLEVTIWTSNANETVAAVPPYLVERLRREGFTATVIYDSVADWQTARTSGDAAAHAITPDYQSEQAARSTQVRVAVIDLGARHADANNTDWLGDRENVLMSDGSRLAYLDIFTSDDSPASLAAHIDEQYTRRGYTVLGLYTLEEFSEVAPRLFSGKSFDAGRRAKPAPPGNIHTTAANNHYHTYEQTRDEFRALATAHPDIASYIKLGSSYEGRDIFALKISKNPGVDDQSKPDVLITGCHHAREWISVETPIYFANQLINNYETDSFARSVVDRLQVWVVPIVNPDGLAYTQSAPDTDDGRRLWRKNRRPMSLGSCVSATGVDLNRNYEYEWRLRGDTPCDDYCAADKSCLQDDRGGSDDPNNLEIYRGPKAASEPEVKVIKSLTDDPNRHFRAQIDYHNYSELILYPWGFQSDAAPDMQTIQPLAQRMSDAIKKVSGEFYRAQQSINLYLTTGSSTDYAYGTNKVAVPLVVEMRPICCEFQIPESQIDITNRENWAGAQTVLSWAVGPPILESLKAYTATADGGFAKLVYSARWLNPADPSDTARHLVVDTRFPGIEPGPLQVRLQFSKSMSTSLAPRATLGRDGRTEEMTLVAGAGEGWQKTVYDNDTWVGQTVLVQDDNQTSAWQLFVAATDPLGFGLDGMPETFAAYATGTGRWQSYEDANGEGTNGGTDAHHLLPPTLRGDFLNLFVGTPTGGERVVGGEPFTVAWTVSKESGFVPVRQEIYLSTDGGVNFALLVDNIPGNVEKFQLPLPRVATTQARIRVLAIEGTVGNAIIGDSHADFTIGANIGAGVGIKLDAAQKLNLNWTDSAGEVPVSGSLRFVIDVTVTNNSNTPIANPFLRVVDLNRGNVLLTRDTKSNPATGARQTLDVGVDNLLSPGESVPVRLIIGIVSKKKFMFSLESYGVAVSGTINAGSAQTVWNKKPKSL